MNPPLTAPGRAGSASRPAHILDAARALITESLQACARQLALENAELAAAQVIYGHRAARSAFRRQLARSIARYLSEWDSSLRAVYLYEPEPEPALDGPALLSDPLHLILWAEPKTAALRSLVAMLDRAIACALAERLTERPDSPAPPRALDVQLIDDAEAQGRLGSAAFLFSRAHDTTFVWTGANSPLWSESTGEVVRNDMNVLSPHAVQEYLMQESHRLELAIRDYKERLSRVAPSGGDEGDQVTHVLEQGQTRTLLEQLQQQLSRVHAACDRLARGQYGICEDCSQPIPHERLAAIPYATLCVRCQSRRERGGVLSASHSYRPT